MAASFRAAALLLASALSACAVGGPLPQPSAGDVPGLSVMGDEGPLAAQRWQAGTVEDNTGEGGIAEDETAADKTTAEDETGTRAVILALHGYGDHAKSTFDAAAMFWAGQGITTLAYDQRGFGRNPSRGIWPGAEGLIADMKAVAAGLRADAPCTPLVVLGHSMGGGVVLAAAPEIEADGLVLAAPAIWGGAMLNPLHRLAAWSAAALVPDRRFTGEGVVRIQASDNIEALRALGRDPLYLSPPSAREIFGLVRVVDRAEGAAAEVDIPALMLIGEKDQILPRRSVEEVFARLAGPQETRIYPDGWHLLFRDLQARRVWQDVADWVLARQAPCAPIGG
ncbi:MAG: alpha/beta fold hydrolase [Pseudomonadota bacterium]